MATHPLQVRAHNRHLYFVQRTAIVADVGSLRRAGSWQIEIDVSHIVYGIQLLKFIPREVVVRLDVRGGQVPLADPFDLKQVKAKPKHISSQSKSTIHN